MDDNKVVSLDDWRNDTRNEVRDQELITGI